VLRCESAHKECSARIDSQNLVKRFDRDFPGRPSIGVMKGPGVIDQYVEFAERIDRGGNKGFGVGFACNVSRERNYAPSF